MKKFDFDNIASTIIPVRYVLRAVIHTTYHHKYAFILSCIFVDLTITWNILSSLSSCCILVSRRLKTASWATKKPLPCLPRGDTTEPILRIQPFISQVAIINLPYDMRKQETVNHPSRLIRILIQVHFLFRSIIFVSAQPCQIISASVSVKIIWNMLCNMAQPLL